MRHRSLYSNHFQYLIIRLGRSIEKDPSRLRQSNLETWSRWIIIHLMIHLVANLILDPSTFDSEEYVHRILVLARDYLSGKESSRLRYLIYWLF